MAHGDKYESAIILYRGSTTVNLCHTEPSPGGIRRMKEAMIKSGKAIELSDNVRGRWRCEKEGLCLGGTAS